MGMDWFTEDNSLICIFFTYGDTVSNEKHNFPLMPLLFSPRSGTGAVINGLLETSNNPGIPVRL